MNLDHIFIDLALTSTDPKKGEVIGVALVRTDARGTVRSINGTRTAYSEKIQAEKEIDADSRPIKESVEAMRALILHPSLDPQFIMVAYGNHDRDFLKKAWKEAGETEEIFGDRRAWLDMSQLVWPLAYCDMVSSRDLASVASCFGFTNEQPDTCTGDVELLMRTYWAMMKRFRLALAGEEAVRSAVGDPLSNALGKLGSLVGL